MKWIKSNISFFIMTLILLLLIILIVLDISFHYENIQEFLLYKRTGCNIHKLNDFVMNATVEDKETFYTFINNLLIFKPSNITEKQLLNIQNLSQISFIPIYNYILLLSFTLCLLMIFIINISIIIYRINLTKYSMNYSIRIITSNNMIKNI